MSRFDGQELHEAVGNIKQLRYPEHCLIGSLEQKKSRENKELTGGRSKKDKHIINVHDLHGVSPRWKKVETRWPQCCLLDVTSWAIFVLLLIAEAAKAGQTARMHNKARTKFIETIYCYVKNSFHVEGNMLARQKKIITIRASQGV